MVVAHQLRLHDPPVIELHTRRRGRVDHVRGSHHQVRSDGETGPHRRALIARGGAHRQDRGTGLSQHAIPGQDRLSSRGDHGGRSRYWRSRLTRQTDRN
ncbi:hypothetical protein SDC9_203056 [bioreactor metagenome]|uniref:Uncharacterized protein n=1 Tax=bioreactor metagenome TaxID=1076179 RepID=A0A645J4F8_9ZZZZ